MEFQPNSVYFHSTEPSLQNFAPHRCPEEATQTPMITDPWMEMKFSQYDWDSALPVDPYLWPAVLHVTKVPQVPIPHILPYSPWPHPDQQLASPSEPECQIYKTDCW